MQVSKKVAERFGCLYVGVGSELLVEFVCLLPGDVDVFAVEFNGLVVEFSGACLEVFYCRPELLGTSAAFVMVTEPFFLSVFLDTVVDIFIQLHDSGVVVETVFSF